MNGFRVLEEGQTVPFRSAPGAGSRPEPSGRRVIASRGGAVCAVTRRSPFRVVCPGDRPTPPPPRVGHRRGVPRRRGLGGSCRASRDAAVAHPLRGARDADGDLQPTLPRALDGDLALRRSPRETGRATITRPPVARGEDRQPLDARPQWGLERTDLVFEELVEGGITRYVAVWPLTCRTTSVRSAASARWTPTSSPPSVVSWRTPVGRSRFVVMMQSTDVITRSTAAATTRTSCTAPPRRIAPAQCRRGRAAPSSAGMMTSTRPRSSSPLATQAAVEGELRLGRPGSDIARRTVRAGLEVGRGVRACSCAGRISGRRRDAGGRPAAAVNVVVLEVAVDWSYGLGRGRCSSTPQDVGLHRGRPCLGDLSKASRTAPIELALSSGLDVTLALGAPGSELVPESGSVKVVRDGSRPRQPPRSSIHAHSGASAEHRTAASASACTRTVDARMD